MYIRNLYLKVNYVNLINKKKKLQFKIKDYELHVYCRKEAQF